MYKQTSVVFTQESREFGPTLSIVSILGLLVMVMLFAGCPPRHSADITPQNLSSPTESSPPVATPPISSDKLKRTLFVPTLDSPFTSHKNVVWCASFPIAWRQLAEYAKEPLLLGGAKQESARLNNAPDYRKEMPKDSWYAAAGPVKSGIVNTINRDMAQRFHRTPTPEIDSFKNADALIAYAFLAAEVHFTTPYLADDVAFGDSLNKDSWVDSLIIDSNAAEAKKQAAQIEVLYYSYANVKIPGTILWDDKFAIDLCKDTPVQLVVASIDRGKTLAQCLAKLNKNCSEYAKKAGDRKIHPERNEEFNVPYINVNVDHHFRELEGSPFIDRRLAPDVLVDAFQNVTFKLTKEGALLKSEAVMIPALAPPLLITRTRRFVCNHPFLLYMKMRNEKNPFFVMWVDNDEVLQKVEEGYKGLKGHP